jgi:putative transposase
MKAIADALGVARSNLAAQTAAQRTRQRRGRPPQPEAELVAEIKALIASQPTYGYRRIHALLRRQRREPGGATVNVKRVYRVMKTHGLLLERHTGNGEERRHDGRIAVDLPDTRWCSDGFEIACDNGERVRIAFTLDGCDREAISWVATTGSINSSDIRDLMIESVERRFGLINRLPKPIELLSDNGSPYTAGETRALARDIGLAPHTTPIESPQSNGMAEAFVKLFKRDYARVSAKPNAASVLRQLDSWFEHYNNVHPHSALGYLSPREFRKQMMEKTTGNAVGAVRRPHDSPMSADVIGVKAEAAGGGGAQRQPGRERSRGPRLTTDPCPVIRGQLQQAADCPFTAFRNGTEFLLAAGRFLQRRQPEPGREIASGRKPLGRWHECCDCRRGYWPHAWNCPQPACRRV